MFHVPNEFRVRTGVMGSTDEIGNAGCFELIYEIHKEGAIYLSCIASDGMGWEHVSCYAYVNKNCFTPNWEQMQFVKDHFWDQEDCVMQLHPPRSNYVNNHPFVLHLWRPIGIEIPQPPKILV